MVSPGSPVSETAFTAGRFVPPLRGPVCREVPVRPRPGPCSLWALRDWPWAVCSPWNGWVRAVNPLS